MRQFHHDSIEALIRVLELDGTPTFLRRVESQDGHEVEIKYPKYLFRGEPGEYPCTFTSLRRAQEVDELTTKDWSLLIGLVRLCRDIFGAATGEGLDGIAFAQHYGVPTAHLDVTNDPMVALHFAAAAPVHVARRTLFRIDLERCFPHVYASCVGYQYCLRGKRQSAWAMCLADKERFGDFDLQHCPRDRRLR
jgi:hypothetical protein